MSTTLAPTTAEAAPQPAPAPSGPLAGNPAILGLPIFVAGSIALGLVDVRFVPATAGATALPIIMAGTGLGLVIATIWAAALGQTLVAAIFGLFAGFWLSYSALVLGLTHNWYAVPVRDIPDAVTGFLLTWAIVMSVLAIATLRLPVAFTAVVVLVVIALVLLIPATQNADETLTKLAGYVILLFAALGAYLFLGAASVAGGGKAYPLGPPLIK